MTKFDSLKQGIKDNIAKIVFLICILQPVLDVISYWAIYFDINSYVTLALRLLLLFATLAVALILTNKRKIYMILFAVLALLFAAHIGSRLSLGYSSIISDIANWIRIYQFPILTVCFITFLKADEKVFSSIIKGFIFALLIITLIEFISVITATNPYTYPNKSLGILGWFYDPSAQSAVLSVLVCVSVGYTVIKFINKPLQMAVVITPILALLFMYATRLAYFTLIIIPVGLAVTLIIKKACKHPMDDKTAVIKLKPILALILVAVLFVGLIPLSPMFENQQRVKQNQQLKQDNINALIAHDEEIAISNGLSGDELKVARLEGAYNEYLGGLVEKFGLKATAHRYNYSSEASVICDARAFKINYNKMLMEEEGILALLFGLELSELTTNGIIHDVENDFHGIFFLCGLSGLLLIILFIGFFLFLTVKALICNFKSIFNLKSASWALALITILFHSYSTAGVLRRPSGSFYFSVILAVIYFLTKSNTNPSISIKNSIKKNKGSHND